MLRLSHRSPTLCRELAFNLTSIICLVVYNPAKVGYWSDVEEAILNCNISFDRLLLLGDLNINWSHSSTLRRILQDSLATCGLTPISFGPTFHRDPAHTTIDYVCVSDMTKVDSSSQVHCPYVLEHDALFVELTFPAEQHLERTVTTRPFRFLNESDFDADL